MKNQFYFILFLLFIIVSCSKDNNEFPKTYKYHHSNILDEKGYLIGNNKSYSEINSKSGSLDSLHSITTDVYDYIEKNKVGYYIESFTLLDKTSVKINTWENEFHNSYTVNANLDATNGEILDPTIFDTNVTWDKSNNEIKFCIALTLSIINTNTFEYGYDYCQSKNANTELENLLLASNYNNGDTIGLYLMEMIYKE
jgi:hypothetical protein